MFRITRFLTLALFLSFGFVAQAQVQTRTIAEIQTPVGPGDDDSQYLGDTVRVRGVVTTPPKMAVSSSTGGRWIWITDTTGGLNVRPDCAGGSPTTPSFWQVDLNSVAVGDTVELIGVVEEFPNSGFSGTQLFLDPTVDYVSGEDEVKLINSGPAPMPTEVDVEDLNNASNNGLLSSGEQYEGGFHYVTNVFVTSVNSTGSRCQFVVSDNNGNKITVYDRFQVQRPDAASGYQDGGCELTTSGLNDFNCPAIGDFYDTIWGMILGSTGSGYSINPFDANHYVKGQTPLAIRTVELAQPVPDPANDLSIDITVSADVFDVDEVVTYWAKGIDPAPSAFDSIKLTGAQAQAGLNVDTIPASNLNDGDTIAMYVRVKGNRAGGSVDSSVYFGQNDYIYFIPRMGGVAKLRDLQTHPVNSGSSIYRDVTGITTEGVLVATGIGKDLGRWHIQDEMDTTYAGIELQVAGPTFNSSSRGDKIRVTGDIEEQFGVTSLVNATLDQTVSTGNSVSFPRVIPDSIGANDDYAEMFESMVVTYVPGPGKDSIYVQDNDLGFTEYLVSNDVDTDTGGRIKVASSGGPEPGSAWVNYVPAVGDLDSSYLGNGVEIYAVTNFGDSVYNKFESVTGVLTYSFSNYKLMPRRWDDFKPDTIQTLQVNVKEEKGLDLTVYPNPVRSELNITAENGSFDGAEFTLVNIMGAVVEQRRGQGQFETINMNNMKPGMYILMIRNREGEVIERTKLIKE